MAEHKLWWASHWQEHLDNNSFSFRDHNSLTLAAEHILGGYKGKKTLEVGSGRGIDSLRMAQKGARAYLVDFTRQALQITTTIGSRQLETHPIQADGESLPFKDESFDLVFSQGVMEHPGDNIRMLQEQARVTRRGGYVLVDVPNKYSLQTPIREIQLMLGRWPYGEEHPHSPSSLKHMMKQVGLIPVKLFGRGLIPIIYLPADSWIRKSAVYNRNIQQNGRLDEPHQPGLFTRYIEVTVGHWFLNNIGIIAQKP